MPSPEQSAGGPPESAGRQEQEPPPYRRAARFAGERPAGDAYFAMQRVIYEAPQPMDLSVYRLRLNDLWHVAAFQESECNTRDILFSLDWFLIGNAAICKY